MGKVKEKVVEAPSCSGVLDSLREEIREMIEEAWLDYRGAVPGDIKAVSEALATSQALRAVIKLIDKQEQGLSTR